MMKTPFVVIKGDAQCLSRGFEYLKKDTVPMTIKTIEYEKQRQFKLVDVIEFDPVYECYEEMGQFYADSITGTLYDPKTGECLSSTQIKLLVN